MEEKNQSLEEKPDVCCGGCSESTPVKPIQEEQSKDKLSVVAGIGGAVMSLFQSRKSKKL